MAYYENAFVVNAPLEKVWAFHDDPAGLTKIMPAPLKIVLDKVDRPVVAGSRILMTWFIGPISFKWNITVRAKEAMNYFTDISPKGESPFALWVHTHAFETVATGTKVIDKIEYEFPFGVLGKLASKLAGNLIFDVMFAPRAKATKQYLESK